MTQEHHHLLVVDDDTRLRDLLEQYLTESNFSVTVAENAQQARTLLETESYDLIVLDVMMPGETGFDLTKSLREDKMHPHTSTPILLLTAMGETDSRIIGLESGADDYMSKPFEPKELLLRIQRILQRTSSESRKVTTVVLGRFKFETNRKILLEGDEQVYLTSTEAELLYVLAKSLGETLTRHELAERSGVTLSPRTVDVQVTRLRKKIEDNPKQPEYLKTIRHKGYCLCPSQ